MDFHALAQTLFGDITATPEDYEALYPPRNLPPGAVVTRIAPSPTGLPHLGNLYNAAGELLARQSGGVFFLRVEDTDQKRAVEGAVEALLESMDYFGVRFDEGVTARGEHGDYGPYRQTERAVLYKTIAKSLVERGLAYPCFCTEEELARDRQLQQEQKLTPGYCGEYARCRNLTLEEVRQNLAQGKPYVLRFRSSGDPEKVIEAHDGIRGTLRVRENNMDFVLLKSDGIPTYHFAHVCDDHFMRVTHVIRDESWLATLPIHLQLFDTLGWERPVYCHTATLMKQEGGSKRKLSKRKDPELALSYYRAEGYPAEAVWIYLLTVLNSNFEDWHREHPDTPARDFPFSLEKMNTAGAIFDLDKLRAVAREYLARQSVSFIYDGLLSWADTYDPELARRLRDKETLYRAAIGVGRDIPKPRKDYGTWKEAAQFLAFYDSETFERADSCPENISSEDRKAILNAYLETLDFSDSPERWFEKVRTLTESLGYAAQVKLYKKNPEAYKGSVVDVTNLLRVALTGRQNAPDIWQVSAVLGEEETRRRLSGYAEEETVS